MPVRETLVVVQFGKVKGLNHRGHRASTEGISRNCTIALVSANPFRPVERSFRQSMERINRCLDLESQQSNQLATWLEDHGGSAAAGSGVR